VLVFWWSSSLFLGRVHQRVSPLVDISKNLALLQRLFEKIYETGGSFMGSSCKIVRSSKKTTGVESQKNEFLRVLFPCFLFVDATF
jgi:hypothetical protein